VNAAVDKLISRVSAEVFKKQSLDDRDTFVIHDCVNIPADSLHRLRPGRWLDSWILKVAMHISDRPSSIKFSESIPVNYTGSDGQVRPTTKPFQAWAKSIAQLRREAEAESCTPLIFFCPIYSNESHFTLLEINDSEKAIRHYDSLATLTTIGGTEKTRIAALVEVESSC
jgi:Ulp1 protease family, C-terminal catalytic domain